MFSIEDFIITVFCNVDDLWQEITQGRKIRARGFAPSLSDSETIAMEIVGEFQGIDTDKGIWSYFRGHWLKLFPRIKSRTTFVRRGLQTADVALQRRNAPAFANLWYYKQELQKILAKRLGGLSDPIHLTDGIPMPLCHYQRAKNCQLFSGLASFGYCAARS